LKGEERSVAIIIPAYQAGLTLNRTLASIHGQHYGAWQAIVVDDGSSDRTADVAGDWARRDGRISTVTIAHGGAARARNAGLGLTRSEWVVFLDADDTLAPEFLTHMLAMAAKDPTVGVVACAFDRRDESGRRSATIEPLPLEDDPFAICRAGTPGAIHSFLSRRSVLTEVGGFDESLTTCEDWDLWVRIAWRRTKFVTTSRCLAHYWLTPSSLSGRGPQMLIDARTVMQRVGQLDATYVDGKNIYGADDASIADRLLHSAFWSAGGAIAQGGKPGELLVQVPEGADSRFQKATLVMKMLDGYVAGSGIAYRDLIFRWPTLSAGTERFLEELARSGEEHALFPLFESIQYELARAGKFRGEIELGHVVGIRLSPARLVGTYDPPAGADIAVFRIPWLRPSTLFSFVLPVFGPISGREIRAAVMHGLMRKAGTVLGRHPMLSRILARANRIAALSRRVVTLTRREPPGFRLSRSGVKAAAGIEQRIVDEGSLLALPQPEPVPESADDPVTGASVDEWEKFFATEDPWNYGSDYEQVKYSRTLGLIEPNPGAEALELACAEGRFTELLAPKVGKLLASDISHTAIERAARRTAAHHNIAFEQRDFFTQGINGSWDLIVCSEVLYYMPSVERLSLFVDNVAKCLKPNGRFIHAHAFQTVDSPGQSAFDWEDTFGAATIFETFRAHPGLRHVRSIVTDLYRIDMFEQAGAGSPNSPPATIERLALGATLEPAVASGVVWNGARVTRADARQERAYTVPALMYHRIASTGPDSLAPYRLSPEMFEHQLRYLRRRGFRSITAEEWAEGASRGGSLRGRPVMLTFDDAYLDFAEVAWPILQRNGFSGHVFVPAGKIGTASDWDASHGTPAPLMNWEQIRDLAAQGATFGSHLHSHRPADALTVAELLDEAVTSRLMIERVTGQPVRTIAPPYGINDTRIEQVLATAGYHRSFIAEGGIAPVCGLEMRTPRIDVHGAMTIEEFAAEIGAGAPDAGDRP
jgi:peptidoglycan/xylan/chitin deacetylase (PgdA/CDA1 family)